MSSEDPGVGLWTGEALTSGNYDIPNHLLGGVVRAITKGAKVGVKKSTKELVDEGFKAKKPTPDEDDILKAMEVPGEGDPEKGADLVDPTGATKKDIEAVIENLDNPAEPPTKTDPMMREGETLPPEEFARKVEATRAEDLARRTYERNINLDYVENADDIGAVVEQVSKQVEISGPKTFSETEANVKASGADKVFIEALKRRGGNLTDEEMLAGRQIMVTLAGQMDEAAKLVANGDAGIEKMAELDKLQQQYVMIQQYMQGKIRDAARTLNSMKIVARTVNSADLEAIAGVTDPKAAVIKAQHYLDARKETSDLLELGDDLKVLSRFKKYTAALVSFRNAAILTGPKTHFVNAISNTLMSGVRSIAVKPMAAGVGYVRTLGAKNADRVYLAETAAETAGFIHGFTDAIRMAVKTFSDGAFTNQGEYVSSFGGRKIDETAEGSSLLGKAIEEDAPWARMTGMPQTLNTLQRTTEAASYGLLTASDEMFKAWAYRKSLYASAVRIAFREGAEDPTARANELLNNVTKDMHDEALRYAEEVTFTNRTKDGTFLTIMADALIKAGEAFPPLRIIIPFIRTPTALFDRSIKMSIAAPIQREFWERVQKGGPDADMAIAEMAFGTLVTGMFYLMYQNGMLTGSGPGYETQGQRAQTEALKAIGWQPNSVALPVGEKGAWMSIARGMEPFSVAAIAITDHLDKMAYSQTKDDAIDRFIGISFAVAKHFKDNTYMKGISDLMDVMGGRINPQKWAAKQAASFIPSLLRDAAAVTKGVQGGDEEYGYTPSSHSFWEMFSQEAALRTPGMEPQAIRRYWDGTPVVGGGGEALYLYNSVSPIRVSIPREDRASQEMVANGVRVSPPSPEVTLDPQSGIRVNLLELPGGAELYDKLTEMVGAERRKIVDSLVNLKAYEKLEEKGRGPGSWQMLELERALQSGRRAGVDKFLLWLNENPLDPEIYGPEANLLNTKELIRMIRDPEEGESEMLIKSGAKGLPTKGPLYIPKI